MSDVIRVIIVDDRAETRTSVKRLLSFADDIRVIGEGSDGRAALRLCREKTPDCVLMDVNMPGLDGITTAQILRTVCPETAVVIMSVEDDLTYRRQAQLAGASSYLVKPFSADELAEAVRQAYKAAARV